MNGANVSRTYVRSLGRKYEMPSLLHEYALDRVALEILGPGYKTRGLRRELLKLFLQDIHADLRRIKEGECRDCSGCDNCNFDPKVVIRDEIPIHLGVIPDAFSVVRDDQGDGYTIRALEVDGSSDLNSKLDRWIDFGEWIDGTSTLFLELTIASLHGRVIGKYTEQDFRQMWDVRDALRNECDDV
jgi:hypothetical protein